MFFVEGGAIVPNESLSYATVLNAETFHLRICFFYYYEMKFTTIKNQFCLNQLTVNSDSYFKIFSRSKLS